MEYFSKYPGERVFSLKLEDTMAADFERWFIALIDYFRQSKRYYPIDKNLQIGAEKALEVVWHPITRPYDVWAKYLPRELETRGEQVIDPEKNAFKIFSLNWLQVGKRLKLVVTYEAWTIIFPPLFEFLEYIGKDWENVHDEILMLAQELGYVIPIPITSPSDSQATKPKADIQEWKPWEHIPDVKDNRLIIEMWCNFGTAKEIGRKVCKAPSYIHNIISDLRTTYPEARIPTEQERKKLMKSL